MKYVISLHVQVTVEAPSARQAEQEALKQGDVLRKSPEAWVSAATLVREAR